MKILAAADIHGDTELARRLAELAVSENVDMVILAGDLFKSNLDTRNIIGPFVDMKKKVVLIPGNHESISTAEFISEQYDAVNLHGYGIKDNDVGLFGCSAVEWGHNLSESDIEEMLQRSHDYIKETKKKIMVTHVHPTNTLMEGFSPFVHGSPAVERMIKKLQPDIFICGHVHEASGIEEKIGNTRVINVSRTGKILDI
jgi:uncharacterized protein